MATSQRVEETQFKQVASIQGSTLFIDKHGANHNDSMDRLKRAGLEPLTYQQAFSTYREVLLTEAQKYFNETGNVMSFYLSGEGIKKDGYYHFDRTGELQEGRVHPDKTAYVYSGKNPLRLDVNPDDYDYGRFDLVADYSPDFVARVVVGVKAGSEGAAELGHTNQTESATVSNVAKALELASVVRETMPQAIAALETSTKQAIVDVLKNIARLASEIKE